MQGTMGLCARDETIMYYRDNNLCPEMKSVIYQVLRREHFEVVPTGTVGLRRVGIYADAAHPPDKTGIIWTTKHPFYHTMKLADVQEPVFSKLEIKQTYQHRVWKVIEFNSDMIGVGREVRIIPTPTCAHACRRRDVYAMQAPAAP